MTQAEVKLQDAYAPPQAHVEDVAAATGQPVLASRSSRFWAAMIDMGIGFAVFAIVAVLTPWNPWRPTGTSLLMTSLVNGIVGFVAFVGIHGWLLTNRGQTVGKAVMRLRIVRTDGHPASAWEVIGLRYGVGWMAGLIPYFGMLYGFADGLLIFRQQRRCIHDLIAGTTVVTA